MPATPCRLFVIAAPSGAGKTTLVKALTTRNPDLRFSISYTTRPKRRNEADGVDYLFVDKDVVGTVNLVAPLRPRRVGDRESQFRVARGQRFDERRLAGAGRGSDDEQSGTGSGHGRAYSTF